MQEVDSVFYKGVQKLGCLTVAAIASECVVSFSLYGKPTSWAASAHKKIPYNMLGELATQLREWAVRVRALSSSSWVVVGCRSHLYFLKGDSCASGERDGQGATMFRVPRRGLPEIDADVPKSRGILVRSIELVVEALLS